MNFQPLLTWGGEEVISLLNICNSASFSYDNAKDQRERPD